MSDDCGGCTTDFCRFLHCEDQKIPKDESIELREFELNHKERVCLKEESKDYDKNWNSFEKSILKNINVDLILY